MKQLFKCNGCGYIHEGTQAPDVCPKCGAPKEMFTQLDEDAAKKVYSSNRTNDIHMEIIALSVKIQELCLEGIEIDLDPPCVSVFEKSLAAAWVAKQSSKAEIAGHVGKGKW